MLNIKEACRYAKFLDNKIFLLKDLAWSDSNCMVKTETHLKSKSNPDTTDEILVVENERVFSSNLNSISKLIETLINEKLMLTLSIEKAKKEMYIDWEENGEKLTLDSAVSYNKMLRSYCDDFLKTLSNKKDSVTKGSGKSYMINAEGNQVSYIYEIEKKSVLDYDKNVIKQIHKDFLEKADKISTLIDQVMLMDVINIEPKYNLYISIEEMISQFENTISI